MVTRILLAAFLLTTLPASTPPDTDPHLLADTVLVHRHIAAFSEWALSHPSDPNHHRTLNVGDRKRWLAVRATFRDLDEAYKRAGY
jgi:hypothetical protein